jgi:hypothetical protein
VILRRWVGTGLLAAPTIAAHVWHGSPAVGAALRAAAGGRLGWAGGGGGGSGSGPSSGGGPQDILPADAVVHITVAWAVGGLMSYLSDWYRRCGPCGGLLGGGHGAGHRAAAAAGFAGP